MGKITWKEILENSDEAIDMSNCEVDEEVRLTGNIGRDLGLNGVIFKKMIFIQSLKENNIGFKNCVFEKGFIVDFDTDINGLNFWDCSFNDFANFRNSKIENFHFHNCSFQSGFSCSEVSGTSLQLNTLKSEKLQFSFGSISFQTCHLLGMEDASRYIFTGKYDEEISKRQIERFSIFFNPEFTGSINLYKISVGLLYLNGFNKSCNINLFEVIIREINCALFTNTGYIKVTSLELQASSKLHLYESVLGMTELFNINFNLFNDIIIINSSIKDIVPINVTWCEKIKTGVENEKVNYFQLREIYRQLKNVMIGNNDKVEELRFHKLEMQAYHRQLQDEKDKLEDKFIMRTNYLSNNHGLSFGRAFLWLFCLSLLIFNLNKLLLGYNSFNSSLIFTDLGNWILSINPVRKFSDVYHQYNTSWKAGLAYFLDIFFRIIYSYLIFQFISAFRKYVKK